jgi:hypothetical protein
MARIKDNQKVRQFMDALDIPMVLRRERDVNGEIVSEIVIVEPTADLTEIVGEAKKHGWVAIFDGQTIRIEEPPEEGLPMEVTPGVSP